MKKKVLSIILTIAMLTCMIPLGTMTAFARNCEDVTITNTTLWDDGSLKSMDVTFDWASSGDEHLYVAVLDEHTESYDGCEEYWYQYDEYQHTDRSSIASSIDDFAKYRNINWYSYGGSGSTPTNGYNTINVSLSKGDVPLNVDRNYSLVMFNAPGGTDYRPTDPLGTLKCDSSTLSFENTSGQSAKVEIPHTHTFSKEWTVNSTGHWHECTAEGCDIKDYSSCKLEGAAYSKHTGLKDDNTCDICGTVFYRPYGVSYTDSTITLKVNVLDSNSEPYTQEDCIRFDAFLRAGNSGTAYDANMNFDENGYYNGTEFAIHETASAAGYCVKNGATYTVVLNAASLDTKITGFDENNPYVWLILRPCHEENGMDYGYSSVNVTYANFYDCSVCLGKFASLKDFHDVNVDTDDLDTYKTKKITEIKNVENIPDDNKETQIYKDVISFYENEIMKAETKEEVDEIKSEALEVLNEFIPEKHKVDVDSGTVSLTQSLNPAKSTKYELATVTPKDGLVDKDGNWFVYWVDGNGEIVSSYSTYSFYVIKDQQLTPVFVSPDEYDSARSSATGIVRVSRFDVHDNLVTVFAERSISKKAFGNVHSYGILVTTDTASADESVLVADKESEKVDRITGNLSGDNMFTGVIRKTIDADEAESVYVRTFFYDGTSYHYGKIVKIDVGSVSPDSVDEGLVVESTVELSAVQANEEAPAETETTPTFMDMIMNILNMIFNFVLSILKIA